MEDMSILITTYEGTHNHPLPLSATAMASTTSAAASMLLSGSSSSTSLPSSATAAPPLLNLYGQPTFHPPYSFSSSNSSPTITLDLITNPSPPLTTAFSLYSSTSPTNPRFPTTNLSFSSMAPAVCGGGGYAQSLQLQGRTTAQQQKYHDADLNQASSQLALTDTLTKVISSDPSFQSAIAAVISTMAASGGARKIDGGEMKDPNSLS